MNPNRAQRIKSAHKWLICEPHPGQLWVKEMPYKWKTDERFNPKFVL